VSAFEDIRFFFGNRVRALYIGYVGYGNLGDEAICSAIKDLFANDISFYSSMKVGLILKLLGNRVGLKAILLGGGTLIKGPSMHLKRLNNAFRLYPNSKLITFGTGVGDEALWASFGCKTDKTAWCSILNRSEYLSVRGPISREFLQNWGVDKQIHVVGDPAMWFARNKISPKQRRKYIGINLGPSRNNIFGQDENRVLSFGANLIHLLNKNGWKITLFPVNNDDIPYLRRAAKMAGVNNLPMQQTFYHVEDTLKALEKQDIFVGEKLHSVVLANCAYTPAIMLEYRTKCRDYMRSINQEKWVYRTDNLDPNIIFDGLNELYKNVDLYQDQIYDQMQYWRRTLKEAAQQVKAIIMDDPFDIDDQGNNRV
jgi:polysaccharide pyruvyl transferase WcaK-like protein